MLTRTSVPFILIIPTANNSLLTKYVDLRQFLHFVDSFVHDTFIQLPGLDDLTRIRSLG